MTNHVDSHGVPAVMSGNVKRVAVLGASGSIGGSVLDVLDRYGEFVQIYGNNFRVIPSAVQDDLFEKYRVGFGAEFFIGRRVVLVYGHGKNR